MQPVRYCCNFKSPHIEALVANPGRYCSPTHQIEMFWSLNKCADTLKDMAYLVSNALISSKQRKVLVVVDRLTVA